MLIFDSFPNRKEAEQFAANIKTSTKRETFVCDTEAEANALDPFPYTLFPPIVLVARKPLTGVDAKDFENYKEEVSIEKAVVKFGGKFAGT